MKRHRIIITGSISIFIFFTVLAMLFYFPVQIEALNPSHGNCSICHSVHGSPGQSLTNYAAVEVLCLSCHGPAGTATKKADVHINKSGSSYPPFRMTCMDCHNPHDGMTNRFGGINLRMVGRNVDGSGDAMIVTPNSGNRYVVFENRGANAPAPYNSSLYSFADGDQDGDGYKDGICEACHTATRFHTNNNFKKSHNVGNNCMACHPHDGYFLFR